MSESRTFKYPVFRQKVTKPRHGLGDKSLKCLRSKLFGNWSFLDCLNTIKVRFLDFFGNFVCVVEGFIFSILSNFKLPSAPKMGKGLWKGYDNFWVSPRYYSCWIRFDPEPVSCWAAQYNSLHPLFEDTISFKLEQQKQQHEHQQFTHTSCLRSSSMSF